jgi:hypothetical protein
LKIQTIVTKIKGTLTNLIFLDVQFLTHEEYYVFRTGFLVKYYLEAAVKRGVCS